jgi:uncharacterized membrane protein YagU involved in acid resistance
MKPNVTNVILGGFVGTLVLTMMMYFVAPMMVGHPMDIAAMLGSMMGHNWTLGMMAHFVNGTVIFPLIYAYLLYKFLPGSPVVKGTLWGVMLWLIAQAMVMPMMGVGFFSSQAGGMKAVMGALIGHLIYGAILGGIARPEAIQVHAAPR